MSGILSADATKGLDDMLLGGIRELLLKLRQRVLAAITDPVVRQQGARQPRVEVGSRRRGGPTQGMGCHASTPVTYERKVTHRR